MSSEHLILKNEIGKITKFVGCEGWFYDVWGKYGDYLGTCHTLQQAGIIMGNQACLQDNPEVIPEDMLKSS